MALGLLAGCSGDDDTKSPGGATDDLSDVRHAGQANDEGLEALLAATPKDEPSQAAVLLDPADGATIPATAPYMLLWKIGSDGSSRLAPPPASSGVRARLAALLEAISPIGTAHAHGSLMNGRGYFVTLASASHPRLLRVFTTDLSYTPDAADWAAIAGVGEPITVTILNGIFEQGSLTVDGGPYSGVPATFSVE
jgi:hypothetical protein